MEQFNKSPHFLIQQQHVKKEEFQMDITEIHTPLATIKHGTYTAVRDFYHKVLPTKEAILSCNCLVGSSTTLNHDNLDIGEQGSLFIPRTSSSL
ncbi:MULTISPECIES: hypothetical protein [unclassified Myroides]|uniref:hypothetical protein n=1 Tax=unclassified Myroides TaxID=2642485 RepID=UPI003D2F8B1B